MKRIRIYIATLCLLFCCTVAVSAAGVITQAEGVVVEGAADAYPENSFVDISRIPPDSVGHRSMATTLAPLADNLVIYDFVAVKHNIKLQPNSPVTATFDIPADFDASKTVVLFIYPNGKAERLPSETDTVNGKIAASLPFAGTYAVAQQVDGQDIPLITIAEDDGTPPWLIAAVSLSVFLVLGIIIAVIYFRVYKR